MVTKTKAKADKAERDEITIKLDAVYMSALNFSKGEQTLVDAVKAAGNDHEAIKKEIVIARMQQSLGYTKAQTTKALDNPERTPDEKKAYGAARVWISAFFKKHGIATQEMRGGARERATKDEMDTGEIVFPKSPKVTTRFELQAYVEAHAQSLVDFLAMNEEHDTVDCEHGRAIWGAAKDFRTSIAEIAAQFTSKK